MGNFRQFSNAHLAFISSVAKLITFVGVHSDNFYTLEVNRQSEGREGLTAIPDK